MRIQGQLVSINIRSQNEDSSGCSFRIKCEPEEHKPLSSDIQSIGRDIGEGRLWIMDPDTGKERPIYSIKTKRSERIRGEQSTSAYSIQTKNRFTEAEIRFLYDLQGSVVDSRWEMVARAETA